MTRAKLGITIVAALAIPIALAAEWVTDREAETEAKTALLASETLPTPPRTENSPKTIRIYPSF